MPSLDQRLAFRRSNDPITLNIPSTAVPAYLLDYRQEIRDAIPAPDCYQIRGYAVLEGVAKNFGGTAHVTVPRKYSGKRVKVVVLDP